MQPIYCHTLNADGSATVRTVDAAYAAGASDLLSIGAPASAAELADKWPGYAAAQLTALKERLKEAVDGVAERLRNDLVTPGAGQAMEYQETQAQAFTALAAAAAGKAVAAADFPMLACTIGLDIDPSTKAAATDVLGVARAVQAAYEAWLAVGSAIRGARLKGKAAIEGAHDADSALAAYAAIVWPAPV